MDALYITITINGDADTLQGLTIQYEPAWRKVTILPVDTGKPNAKPLASEIQVSLELDVETEADQK